jgi:Domain of unknown function (DUF4412)
MRLNHALLVGGVLFASVAAAQAGWVIEQSNVSTKPKGEAGPSEPSTMRISQGRIRVSQPSSVTIQDCVKGRFAIFVPDRNTYWSGTLDDYAKQITAAESEAAPMAKEAVKRGKKAAITEPKVDVATLPKIVVRKTDEHAKIAGYDTVKYEIESDGRKFEELWLTTALNLKDDLEPKQYLACQAKMSLAMRGASGKDFNALYRSPDYLALASSGFPMKTIVYHIAGSFTREVRSINRADVSDSDFEIPDGAKKVSLSDLFGPASQ